MPLELYYWPMIPGRGEFARWILEDVEVEYVDVGRRDGFAAIVAARREGIALPDGRRIPVFAPPALATDDQVIVQTALIAQYLGETHDRAPTDPAGQAEARSFMALVADVVNEVHSVHHPVSSTLTYDEQQAEAVRAAALFASSRLPKWLGFFEHRLAKGSPFLYGDAVSYVDIALAVLLRGLDHMFPKAMAGHAAPRLRELKAAVEARPALQAYRASDRCIPYGEHGIFRYHSELDAPAR